MESVGTGDSHLQVAKLGKALVAVVQLALKRLGWVVCFKVRPDIPSLREALLTLWTLVWLLSRVAPFMCLVKVRSLLPRSNEAETYLQVAKLRESMTAAGQFAGLYSQIENEVQDGD